MTPYLGPTALLLAWHLLGILLVRVVAPPAALGFACCSGVLWGAALYGMLAGVVLTLGIPYTATTMSVATGVLALGLVLVGLRGGRLRGVRMAPVAISVLVCAAVTLAATALRITPMTPDSSGQVMMGRSLALYGGFDPELSNAFPGRDIGWFSNYGALLPILQSTALFVGLPYHPALSETLMASLLATLIFGVQAGLRRMGASGGAWIAALLCAALLSSCAFAAHVFYVHNSMPSGAYLLLFFLCGWLGLRDGEPRWFALASLAIVPFCMLRLEAPLFAMLYLALLLSHPQISYKHRLAIALAPLCFVLMWYETLARVAGTAAYMLTPQRMRLLMMLLAAFGVFVGLSAWRPLERVLRAAPRLSVLAGLVALAGVWLVKPEHSMNSAASVLMNLSETGSWAALWMFIGLLVMLAPAMSAIPFERFIKTGLGVSVLLIFALGSQKNPYRLGFSDSANRMLMHLVPTLGLFLTWKFAQPATAPVSRWRWLRAATLGLLTLLAWGLVASRRHNYSLTARVIEAPRGAPGFEMQYLPDERIEFFSGVERCPTTALFDLGDIVDPMWLEMELHDVAFDFRDFAWQVSADRRRWIQVFDTRDPAHDAVRISDGTRFEFDLRQAPPFRFARLTLRWGGEGDRMVLSRARFWSSPPAGRLASVTRRSVEPAEWLAGHLPQCYATREVNWATGATLLDGPRFKDGRAGAWMLNGRADERFAESVDETPCDVTIDLGWEVSATALEWTALDAESAPSRYAWSASTDGVTWRTLVDTDGASWASPRVAADAATRIDLPEPVSARYLKLSFREAGDGGSLRLKRIAWLAPLSSAVGMLPPGTAADFAPLAHVMTQPACAPGYEVEVALRGVSDGRFVSAVEPCPSIITLDMGRELVAERLEVEEHDPARGFESFAWQASQDGQAWLSLYDCEAPVEGVRTQTAANISEFDLRGAGPFRYLRLTLRSARGENRLLLNRISVWGDVSGLSASPASQP